MWGTLYGIWLGAAIPAALDVSGKRAAGFGILVGGPTGFLAARAVTRARPLTKGQAGAITWGGTWGTWQGLGWSIVALWNDGDTERKILTSAILGGAAGVAAGYGVSREEIPAGLSLSVQFASLWGSWFGFLTSYVIYGPDDEDFDERAILSGTLLGGNAGLVGMAFAGDDWGLSVSRARIISLAGIMGGGRRRGPPIDRLGGRWPVGRRPLPRDERPWTGRRYLRHPRRHRHGGRFRPPARTRGRLPRQPGRGALVHLPPPSRARPAAGDLPPAATGTRVENPPSSCPFLTTGERVEPRVGGTWPPEAG